MTSREILEGRQNQGVEEEITYTLTVPASWGTPTGTPTVKGYLFDGSTFVDKTSTVFPAGSASVNGQVISLPEMKSLTADSLYRVEVKFDTNEGNIMEAGAWVYGER